MQLWVKGNLDVVLNSSYNICLQNIFDEFFYISFGTCKFVKSIKCYVWGMLKFSNSKDYFLSILSYIVLYIGIAPH